MDAERQAAAGSTGVIGPAFLKGLEELLVTLRRSSKDLAFYPTGHPALERSLERALRQLHAMVGARQPLTITVSRTGFGFEGRPLGAEKPQLASMAAELFVKRIQKLFFSGGVEAEELTAFLRMITSDAKELFQQGGPGKVLAGQGVRRIQVNEFEFHRLAETPAPATRTAGGPGAKAGPGGAGVGGGPRGSPAADIGGPSEAGAGAGVGSGAAPAEINGLVTKEGSAETGETAEEVSLEAADMPSTDQTAAVMGHLLTSLGPQEEQTVAGLLQRLEREASSGELAGYEWVSSRLEAAAGQAVREGWLADILAILRVFLAHRQDENRVAAPLRTRAAQAVEAIATGETVEYLVGHVGSPVVETGADLAAVLLGLGAPVIPRLMGRLAAEDQGAARQRLVTTLVKFREVALPVLGEALSDADQQLACDLATILGEIGGEASVTLLARLARHREVRVRAEAVRALGQIGGPLAHRPLMQSLRDPDPNVAGLAIGLLGTARVKQVVPALVRLATQRLMSGPAFAVRKAAVAALGAVGDPGVVSTLAGLLHTRTWFYRAAGDELRQAAALALLGMGRAEARQVVEAGARSRRADVRRACGAALQQMMPAASTKE